MKRPLRILVGVLLAIVLCAGLYYANYYNLLPKKRYTASDFNITTIVANHDEDMDGTDDYLDIVESARAYLATRPHYQSAYYANGYPPEGIGVCTDVIWRALQGAGYEFKTMVDTDILANPQAYPDAEDANIDFRRVRNLWVYFARNAISLTLNPDEIDAWQPGDIVIYPGHIAIVSDVRNKQGQPYILHHGGQPVLEEDALTRQEILGHYRLQLGEIE